MLPWADGEITAYARFESIARQVPRRIAVREGACALTYQELHQRVLAMASVIDSEAGEPLGVVLSAGIDFVVAVLAALRQGRPYVPLSPSLPPTRRDEIIRDAGVRNVVEGEVGPDPNGPVPPPRARPDSVACVLYTSGSTGRPKGVYQSQAILLHDVRSYGEAIRLQPDDVMTWLYPAQTGGAVRDIFGALLHGAELVVMDPLRLGLSGVARVVQERAITVFHAIPPLLREFLAAGPAREQLGSVRMLYVAGDRFFRRDLEAIRRVFPAECLVYTGLGATECTTLHRHWVLSADTPVDTELVPVGFDVPGKQVRIVDEAGCAVAPGEVGELEVNSAFIALGYWRNPALTREAFRIEPGHPDRRTYRTGDLGWALPDGNIVFVGRKDGRVKIRGHQVDLVAVESVLRDLPEVRDAAVLVLPGEEPELVAVLVPEVGACECPESCRTGQVRKALTDRLSASAIPTRLVWRDALPRLDSYKMDRARLLDEIVRGQARVEVAAEGPVEALWRRATRDTGALDRDITFAEAGGHSLSAMRLYAELEKWVGEPLPMGLLHAGQTLRGLMRALEDLRGGRPVVDTRPVWFVVGGITWLLPHAEAMSDQETFPVRLHVVPLLEAATGGALDVRALGQKVAEAVLAWRSRHGDSAPVGLLGVSLGALIVHEAACCLQGQGVSLAGLAAYDLGPASPQLSTRWNYRVAKAWRALRRGARRFSLSWAWAAALDFALPLRWARTRAASADGPDVGLDRMVLRSLPAWRPRRYDGTLMLLKPVEGFGMDSAVPVDFGWGSYAARVRVETVPGGHLDLLAPGVRETVLKLLVALE